MPYVLRLEDDSEKTLTRKLRDLQGAERDAYDDALRGRAPTRRSETWSDLRPLRGRKPEGQVHGQEEPYCLNDHDTDAIEVDSTSRHSRCSRTRRRPIRQSAEDAARVQREAWSDVEPAEEKRTEGARSSRLSCSESSQ